MRERERLLAESRGTDGAQGEGETAPSWQTYLERSVVIIMLHGEPASVSRYDAGTAVLHAVNGTHVHSLLQTFSIPS